jgi:hypothetical protein
VLDRNLTSTETGTEAGISDRFPEWCAVPTNSSVRDVETPPPTHSQNQAPASVSSAAPRFVGSSSGSAAGTPTYYSPSPAGSLGKPKGNWKDLDAFYASSESEEEEGTEEEEEEEEGHPGDQEGDEDNDDEMEESESGSSEEEIEVEETSGGQNQPEIQAQSTRVLDEFYD